MTSNLPSNERTHSVRFYDPVSGDPVNLTGLRLSSAISFNWKLNKAPDQVKLEFNIPYYDQTELEGLNIIISVINKKYPLGKIVFQGVVEKTTFTIDGGLQKATFQCIGEYSFFSKTLLRFTWLGAGNYFNSDTEALSVFITNIIEEFNTSHPSRTYNTSGIENNATSVFYKGNVTKQAKAIDDLVRQSQKDWYITFDAERNVLFTDQFNVHELTLGRDVTYVKASRDGSRIINSVVIGYEEPPGTPLVYETDNVASIAQFGLSETFEDFNEQFDGIAAQNYGDKLLEQNDELKISGNMRVNANYNFEDIKPGDKVRLKNTRFGNDMFDGLLRIISIKYADQFAILQIEEEEGDFINELRKAI